VKKSRTHAQSQNDSQRQKAIDPVQALVLYVNPMTDVGFFSFGPQTRTPEDDVQKCNQNPVFIQEL
jgi:hypothetical protein